MAIPPVAGQAFTAVQTEACEARRAHESRFTSGRIIRQIYWSFLTYFLWSLGLPKIRDGYPADGGTGVRGLQTPAGGGTGVYGGSNRGLRSKTSS